ncbi:MAG: ComEC/Rec2 family competence protein [Alphaproteobacteria bacterium]|nr:ComEC/Rec2 family competence protein [Alphaproteobacteria bacterium]
MMRRFWQYIHFNFTEEQSRWIALVPVLFGLGIGLYFSLDFEPKYWISLIFIEILLLIFYFTRYKVSLHLPLYGLLLITLGFANAQLHTMYQSRRVEQTENISTYITGKIIDISQSAKGKFRYTLANAYDFDKPLKGKFRITSMTKDNDFAVGDCVETAAKLLEASPIPLKNSFNLSQKYFFENLSAIGYTLGDTFKISCRPEIRDNTFFEAINSFRHETIMRINSLLPTDKAGIIDALLVGEKSYIPQEISANYRNSGLAHFLAVSGLHLGTIAGLVFFLVRWLVSLFPFIALRYDSKKIAAVFAILFTFIYLLISGMAIPAERAFIMTSTVLVGVFFNRQAISLRMVSFAAFMVLLISPSALLSISFQMSFAAATSLVVFYEKYSEKISSFCANNGFIAKAFYYLLGIIICDFVASLATSPFAVYHFRRLAIYTCLGNLLAGPLIAFWLMPAILLCLISLPFGALYYPLHLLSFGIEILNSITAYVSALPGSVLYIHSLDLCGFLLIICGAIWLCIWQRKWRYIGAVAIICGIITMFGKPAPDAVISFDGNGVALRDNNNDMVLVPLGKANNFTKEIWKENLEIRIPDKEETKIFKKLFSGKTTNNKILDITCDKDKNCVYKNSLKFNTDGTIFLHNEQIDKKYGAYVYITPEKAFFEPLKKIYCRPWNDCNK